MKTIGVTILVVLFALTTSAQQAIKNYYGIPETITYDSIEYKLSASYHPNEHYYKQEYLPLGTSFDNYKSMLIIDFYVTEAPAQQLAQLKIKELENRKATDPVTNYDTFDNKNLGESMLDFILSDANKDKISVVEHNLYRYQNYTDKKAHKGILMFAISTRGYLEGIEKFLKKVKKDKMANINRLGTYSMPKVELN